MDIVFKEGKLYLQGIKFGKKTWRRTWLILFRPTISGIGRVELYDMQDTSFNAWHLTKPPQLKRAERRVVRLCDCLSITPAPGESCPPGCTGLYLNTTLRTYTLASETCQDWIVALCQLAFQKDPEEIDTRALTRGSGMSMEDNDLYSTWKTDVAPSPEQYQVTVQATEASVRCRLAGDYLFSLDKEAVWLVDLQTAHVICHWSYKFLRRFGQTKGGFSIEAGRRCDSGEGTFSFLSRHGPQIHQAIAKQCLLEQSPKPFSTQSPSACKDCLADSYPKSPMVEPPTQTKCPPGPPVSKPPSVPPGKAVEPASEVYATIGHGCASDCSQPAIHRFQKPNLTGSLEGGDGRYTDEDDVGDDSIYCNLDHWMRTKVKDQTDPERGFSSSESIYSLCKIPEPPLPSQPQPQHLSFPLSQPLTHSHSQLQPFPYPLPKPRYQPRPQSLVKTQPQPQSLVKTQPQPQSLVKTQPQPQSLAKTQPKPQLLAKTQPQPQSLVRTQPQPQSLVKTQPQPQSLVKTQPQPQSLVKTQPQPQSLVRTQPQPQSLVKTQQVQSLVKTQQVQPRYQSPSTGLTQPQEGEDSKGEGDAKCHSPSFATTVSFKQKLSEIISKDLAKLQPPLPSGVTPQHFLVISGRESKP